MSPVRTSNPALSDTAFERVAQTDPRQAGWAAPTGPVPAAPDEVSPWRPGPPTAVATDAMTVNGAVSATAVLLVLLVASSVFGWNAVESTPDNVQLPGWIFLPLLGAIGAAIATIVKPGWARATAPLYAVLEGVVVGAISRLYESQFDGIVLQAAASTVAVLGIMLFLYATRIIKVTDKLRMGIIMATGAIAVVYLLNFVLRMFGTEVPFLHDTGTIGILISLAIVAVAAFNLLLDFDFVERGVAARAPKQTEWYAAFGLLLTLVWLYLELLRLLAKLQRD
jgi:uncharacterized YccA/Bax inhibitor family protein